MEPVPSTSRKLREENARKKKNVKEEDDERRGQAPKIMTFTPTIEEFMDFNGYIKKIESAGGHLAGICKVIPPKEANFPQLSEDEINARIIERMVSQEIIKTTHPGVFTTLTVDQSAKMTVEEYRKTEVLPKRMNSDCSIDDIEAYFFKTIYYGGPHYASDNDGTLMEEAMYWKMSKLGSIIDEVAKSEGNIIAGVMTAYLYYGLWKNSFNWHSEDMDFYSLNYQHFGAGKVWYSIPPAFARRFEKLVSSFFPMEYKRCPAFMRHKGIMITPKTLKKYEIPYDRVVQNRGEFIITFPLGYHMGFNMGFNLNEAINFASERWIDYGKRAKQCYCRPNVIDIDMRQFVKKYQPTKYKSWSKGLEYECHPEENEESFAIAPDILKKKRRLVDASFKKQIAADKKILKMQPQHDTLDEEMENEEIPWGDELREIPDAYFQGADTWPLQSRNKKLEEMQRKMDQADEDYVIPSKKKNKRIEPSVKDKRPPSEVVQLVQETEEFQEIEDKVDEPIMRCQKITSNILEMTPQQSSNDNNTSRRSIRCPLIEETRDTFPCPNCGKIFDSKKGRYNHMAFYKLDKTIACDLCPKKFTLQIHLTEHKKFSHPIPKPIPDANRIIKRRQKIVIPPSSRQLLKRTKPSTDEQQDKSFSKPRYGLFDIKVKDPETGETSIKNVYCWQCRKCEKTFKDERSHNAHFWIHQKSNESFKCKQCQQKFDFETHLLRHIRKDHKIIGDFKCNKCTANYKSIGDLNRHH